MMLSILAGLELMGGDAASLFDCGRSRSPRALKLTRWQSGAIALVGEPGDRECWRNALNHALHRGLERTAVRQVAEERWIRDSGRSRLRARSVG